ncbi:OmpP1/FadL family transporter [Shimia sp. MMG029]|uniref:OmpP1/FadL family transporter n=1 Tax=Shimia sp. MMG029 TaxID=3021978 RepID=UPI0022FEFF20|nr:outer membrane protein transport protein [Shimia sp. MMG029]MDA5556088.1 outer membrane protein transport protein [Shimia sp. MMG029]
MKKMLMGATALAMVGGASYAGGIDRSGQGVNILFEEGNYAQFTYRYANPSVTGTNAIVGNSNDVAQSFSNLSFGYKHEITDNLDLALIYDQPFGAHIHYTDGPLSAGGVVGLPFDGLAEIDSDAVTALLQYRFDNGFSIHGGARALKVDGVIQSSLGILRADSDFDLGGVVGVAYEKPEIALRVALTYATEVKSGLEGVNAAAPAGAQERTFDVDFPESVNLDFQTGIAANTLLFGSVRWVGWGGFSLDTVDGQWVNFDDDTITYSLGVGRQINDKLSLALQFGYESAGDRPTTTALAPTTGSRSIGLGATYQINDQLSVSGAITYAQPGDQFFPIGAAGNIDFNDNEAWGGGIRIGYRF